MTRQTINAIENNKYDPSLELAFTLSYILSTPIEELFILHMEGMRKSDDYKKVSLIGSLVIIVSIGSYGVYEWITKEMIDAATIFFVFLGIGLLFQSITWGEMNGVNEGKRMS